MPHPILANPDLIRLEGDTPHLVGSRCDECGEVYFPATDTCTRCTATHMSPHVLGHRGTLWSWTIQGFLPKAPYNSGETPETFRPYGVGYVQMDNGLKIESRLTVADEAQLQIGMSLELTLIPYRTIGDGEVFTFAFRPSASA